MPKVFAGNYADIFDIKGKKAVVVYNVDTKKANTASVSIDGSSAPLVMASPEKPAPAKFTGAVTLGPQSAVVIMEK